MSHGKDKKKKRRIMRDFKIFELSAVDRPAQGHAKMTLLKREPTSDSELHDLLFMKHGDLCFKLLWALCEEKDANPSESIQGFFKGAKFEPALPYIKDLSSTLESILKGSGDKDVKMTDMAVAVSAFLNMVQENLPDVGKALVEKVSGNDAGDIGNNEGDGNMPAAVKKEHDGLEKQVQELEKTNADLQQKLDTALAASDDAAKAVELQSSVDELTSKVDELSSELERTKAEKVEVAEKAKMSDDERAFLEGMGDDEKKNFLGMSPSDRRKKMKKAMEDDEVITIGDEEVRKSAVGDAMFAIIKKQHETNEATQKRLDEAEELRKNAEFAKRAEDELEHFSGDLGDKIDVLRNIEKMDESARDTLMKMLESGQKAIKAGFATIGHSGGDSPLSGDDLSKAQAFQKRVSEIQTQEKCSGVEAMRKARKEDPDGHEAYRLSGPTAN